MGRIHRLEHGHGPDKQQVLSLWGDRNVESRTCPLQQVMVISHGCEADPVFSGHTPVLSEMYSHVNTFLDGVEAGSLTVLKLSLTAVKRAVKCMNLRFTQV